MFAAVCPQTGQSNGWVMSTADTEMMNVQLRDISGQVGDGVHVLLLMDQAGWHTGKKLEVPENITIVLLPPYSPQLNPVELIWRYLRQRYLSNRAYADGEALEDAVAEAHLRLSVDLLGHPWPNRFPKNDLARLAAILPLYTRRLVAFLRETGLIHHANGVLVGVIAHHYLLYAAAHRLVVPTVQPQKLLQRPRRNPSLQCDRLDAFSFQIAYLTAKIGAQVRLTGPCLDTVVKLLQKLVKVAP